MPSHPHGPLPERLIHDLAETFSASGDAFFRNLVLQIVKAVHLDFAIIVEIDAAGADTARTIAICDRGRIIENFEYPVAGTPCERTLRSGVFARHPRDLARLFPAAPFVLENGFESYIGIPLQDGSGQVLGLLAVLHRAPIEDTHLTESLLRILAARAAVELERRRVGERIRRSRDAYLEVLDDFPTPIWRADVKGRCDFFNRAWLEFRGRTLAQELGTGFVEGMPGEDLERLRARFLVALREQKPFEIEGRLRRHDGELRTLVDVGRPYLDAEGRFAGFVGACYDITDRLRAEDNAREVRRFLETILEHAPMPIFTTSLDGRFLHVNSAWERTVGRRREDAVGRTCSEIFPPELAARFGADSRRVAETGTPMATEIPLSGPWGEYFFRTIKFPLRDASGRVSAVTGISLDISERKNAEERLRASESRFRHLIERLPDAILVHHRGRIVFANPGAARLLEWDRPEDLLGESIVPLMHPDDREAITAIAFQAVQTGEASTPGQYRCVRRSGSVAYGEFQVMPIEFDGKPSVLVVGRDVTERRQMQVRLLQADRLASLGTLAAGVAHEINNPLAYVLSSLKFLSEELPRFRQEAGLIERDAHLLPAYEDGQAPEKVRWIEIEETLADACEGAERVRGIVRDLRTFTRADEEKQEALDVRRVLESTIKIASHEIRHRASFHRDYQDVPPVRADEGRLCQVFLNLLVNAAQALPLGEIHQFQIRVATKTDEEGHAVIEFYNNGPAIPPEILGRIFDPFFTTKPLGQGTGLGLSICHHIVTGLGGSISVESQSGHGTSFRVTLPPAPFSP